MISWLLSCVTSLVTWLLTPVPLALVTASLAALYLWYTRNYNFWRQRGVPGPSPKFPLGSSQSANPFGYFSKNMDNKLYYEHGGKKYCGYIEMMHPVLFVGDPDLIKTITIKDFDSFVDFRKLESCGSFSEMLFSLSGEKWKHTRSVMTPTFSASKLKGMHDITLENAQSLSNYVTEQSSSHGELDMKFAANSFTMDNIADCAFGVHCNSFTDPNQAFAKNASKLVYPDTYMNIMLGITFLLPTRIGRLIPDPFQGAVDFFSAVTEKTIAERRRSGVVRRDFLQMLLDTKDKDGNQALTWRSMVQQCALFFIAGYETTATLITFATHSLAHCPEVQARAHAEIDEVLERHGGKLDYEAVMDMPYLDRVMSETLRMYPPVTRLEREVTKVFTIPGTKATLPLGTLVQIPVYTIHHDPEHYPDPEKFEPDRFLPDVKDTRHPCTYLPFGSGPRNCIAMRFALFEAKVALAALLKEVRLEPSERTPPMPCPLDKDSFAPTPPGRKMYLRSVPRNVQ